MKISLTLMWKTEVVMTKGGTDLVLFWFWSSFVLRIVFVFMSQQGQGEEGGIFHYLLTVEVFITRFFLLSTPSPTSRTVTFILDTLGVAGWLFMFNLQLYQAGTYLHT